MKAFSAFFLLLILTALPIFASDDLQADLEQAGELAQKHRYGDIIDLLAPWESEDLAQEPTYIVAAEVGRAFFHLGGYQEADRRFRRAVKLQPERLETALYLQATSYLLGRRQQAFQIFGEVVRSGARDLWLAVSLPGESRFLADPEAWKVVAEHAVHLRVDLDKASVLGVSLGQPRTEVVGALGAGASNLDAPSFSAHAGPQPIWVFTFDDQGLLAQVALEAEHLLRYTPYRLSFGPGLDWSASPLTASAVLGPPRATEAHDNGDLSMIWDLDLLTLGLTFGRSTPPRPPVLPGSAAILKMVLLKQRS